MRLAATTLLVISLSTAFMTAESAYSSRAMAAEANAVSEEELQGLFPGQFKVIVRGILRLYISAQHDGSLFARQIGKSDTGTWEIRADRLCIKFSKWLNGRTRCSRVIAASGWYKTTDVAFKKIDGMALANQ
jgi:hypothetical protein